MSKIEYACPQCGSTHILKDATAWWDVEAQQWKLSDHLLDFTNCADCDWESDHGGAIERTHAVRQDHSETCGEFVFGDHLRFRWMVQGERPAEVLGWFEDSDRLIVKGSYGYWRTNDPAEALRRARRECGHLIGEA